MSLVNETKLGNREAEVHGQTALITGGTSRIGRACALALASEGVNIVVHYRTSKADAEALCGELVKHGVAAWSLQADFSKGEDVTALIGRAKEAAGTLNVLVNNASIFPAGTLEDLNFSGFMENMVINTWTPFALSREFKRTFGEGAIVNCLDSRIYGYDFAHAGYIMSKHSLALLTRMMALEFAPRLRVNAVAPGLVAPPPGKDQAAMDRLASELPLKRHGDLYDVARAVVFLVKSGFITGQVICVDGGRHLRERGGGVNSGV